MSRGVNSTLLEALRNPYVVRPAYFVHLGFREPVSVWTGNASIDAHGKTWTPQAGELTISDLSETLDTTQPRLTVALSGYTSGDFQAPDTEGTQKIVVAYTGCDQVITVPAGARSMLVKAWGAGGGPDQNQGGYGGFTRAEYAVNPGDQFSVVVGQGGINITTVYGFGGTGQGAAHQHNGGGLSGLFLGAAPVLPGDSGRALVIAGGGGAGGWNGSVGRIGDNGNDATSAGYGGMPDMRGQDANGTVSSGLGGGGGGYRGGASYDQWGAGGSGYTAPGSLSAPVIEGTPFGTFAVPRASDPDYIPGVAMTGGRGLVVVEFTGIRTAYEAPCLIYIGATDENGALIGSPHLMFSGTVASVAFDIDPEAAVKTTIEINGAPPIVEAPNGRKYSDAGQRRLYPADKGMQYLAAVADQPLHWGPA
jgi:hypothetical protein